MAAKAVSLRLPEELVERLSKKGDNFTQTVINELNNLERIRLVSLGEVKGLFTPQEWIFIADAFNGTLMDSALRANVGVFIASCEDAERFEGKASLNQVDLDNFLEKVRTLRGANIEAIITRVEEYWEHCGEIDINNWSQF